MFRAASAGEEPGLPAARPPWPPPAEGEDAPRRLQCSRCEEWLELGTFTRRQQWNTRGRSCRPCEEAQAEAEAEVSASAAAGAERLGLVGPAVPEPGGPGLAALGGPLTALFLGGCGLRQGDPLRKAWACLSELDNAVRELGADLRVSPFGSAANGFWTRDSDLDVTVHRGALPSATEDLRGGAGAAGATDPGRSGSTQALRRLRSVLHRHAAFAAIGEVDGARVPLLKLRYAGVLDVDVSWGNLEPLPNTRLLRAYAELHPVVRGLAVCVKLWAKAEGVCDAAVGHLSSYAFTLMALYCLQVSPEVQLPCLPVGTYFEGTADPATELTVAEQPAWTCLQPLPLLLSNFFQFFASDFRWGVEVVSVRLGRREAPGISEFAALQNRTAGRLHIEDPFLRGRNLGHALGAQQERLLRERLRRGLRALEAGLLPEGLRTGG